MCKIVQVQSCFRNASFGKKLEFWETERKCQWELMRRICIPNFISIGRYKRGEKWGEPKTGEKWGEQDTRSSCQICRFQTVTKCDPS